MEKRFILFSFTYYKWVAYVFLRVKVVFWLQTAKKAMLMFVYLAYMVIFCDILFRFYQMTFYDSVFFSKHVIYVFFCCWFVSTEIENIRNLLLVTGCTSVLSKIVHVKLVVFSVLYFLVLFRNAHCLQCKYKAGYGSLP